jgi:DNA modification methylase
MMINYPKPNAHLRIKFLEENTFSVHEYVWTYNTNIGLTKKYFTSAHRSILHAVKMKDNNFFKKNVAEPYLNPGPVRQKNMKKIMENNPDLSEDEAEELFEKVYKGRMPYSWISEPLVKNVSDEKTIHPCQIPKNVSRKLIHACTEPEDTILVLFGGSGSECEVCKEGGRNFITTEIHEKYNRMIKERIKQGKIPDRYRHHLRKNY